MNAEKLKQLQASQASVRIGGKGTARRKKKVVHRTANTDDKKLQSTLKKLAVGQMKKAFFDVDPSLSNSLRSTPSRASRRSTCSKTTAT